MRLEKQQRLHISVSVYECFLVDQTCPADLDGIQRLGFFFSIHFSVFLV